MRIVKLLEPTMVHQAYANLDEKDQVMDRDTGRSVKENSKDKDKEKKEKSDRKKRRKQHPKLKDIGDNVSVIHVNATIKDKGNIIKVNDVVAAILVSEGAAEYA